MKNKLQSLQNLKPLWLPLRSLILSIFLPIGEGKGCLYFRDGEGWVGKQSHSQGQGEPALNSSSLPPTVGSRYTRLGGVTVPRDTRDLFKMCLGITGLGTERGLVTKRGSWKQRTRASWSNTGGSRKFRNGWANRKESQIYNNTIYRGEKFMSQPITHRYSLERWDGEGGRGKKGRRSQGESGFVGLTMTLPGIEDKSQSQQNTQHHLGLKNSQFTHQREGIRVCSWSKAWFQSKTGLEWIQ